MSTATAPAAYGPGFFIMARCERYRGEGCYGIANRLREDEATDARLAVQAIQTGKDPSFFLEEAGLCRVIRYEYQATGQILRELNAERLAELRRRTAASNGTGESA